MGVVTGTAITGDETMGRIGSQMRLLWWHGTASCRDTSRVFRRGRCNYCEGKEQRRPRGRSTAVSIMHACVDVQLRVSACLDFVWQVLCVRLRYGARTLSGVPRPLQYLQRLLLRALLWHDLVCLFVCHSGGARISSFRRWRSRGD